MIRSRRHLVKLLAGALSAIALGSVTSSGTNNADAHVSQGHFGWFWYLGTRSRQGDKELDPLDMVWTPGRQFDTATPSNVEDFVEQEWRHRPAQGQMNHGALCLAQRVTGPFGFVDGRQFAVFRSNTPVGRQKRLTDFQESTSSRCFSQYHMRFWTDETHYQITSGHDHVGMWNISGVHHDIAYCGYDVPFAGRFGGCHQIYGRWAGYRNYAVNRALRQVCGRSRWRMYPGGDRNFQGHRFDGYLAKIVGTHDSQGCPNGLH